MQDFEYNDSSFDPLEGKIIARMPNLGQGQEVPKPQRLKYLPAFSERVGKVTVVFSPDAEQQEDAEQEQKTRNSGSLVRDLFCGRKFFYTRCLVAALVLVLCLGGVAFHKLEKKKRKLSVRETAVQKDEKEQTQAGEIEKGREPQKVVKPVLEAKTVPAAKPASPANTTAAKPVPVTSPEKKTEPSVSAVNTAAAKPKTTPTPVNSTAAVRKDAEDTKPSVAATAKPPKNTVVTPPVETGEPSDSPWERSTADAYSPWAMSSTERLRTASLSPEEKPTIEENPAASVIPAASVQTTAAVPAEPMSDRVAMNPIMPLQTAPLTGAPIQPIQTQPEYSHQPMQYTQQYPSQYPSGQPAVGGQYQQYNAAQMPANPSFAAGTVAPPSASSYPYQNPYPSNNPNPYPGNEPVVYQGGYVQTALTNSAMPSYQQPPVPYSPNVPYQPQPNVPANAAPVPTGQYQVPYSAPYPSGQPAVGGQYPQPVTNNYNLQGNYYQQGNTSAPYRRVF